MQVSVVEEKVTVFKPVTLTITLESAIELNSFLEAVNLSEPALEKMFSALDRTFLDARVANQICSKIWHQYHSLNSN